MMPVRSIISGAFLVMGFGAATVVAAPQTNIAGGVFVEAEHYDGWPWYSEAGFGQRQEDDAASGHGVLAGMWKKGALYYTLTARSPGEYNVWMRCAVPGKAQVRFGANIRKDERLQSVTLAPTTTKASLTGEGAYGWRRLGRIRLNQGVNRFVLGQGAQRPDCFFLTRLDEEALSPSDELLRQVRLAKEAPKGQTLPELIHDRQISHHPRWLRQRGLRAAYGHLEWDPKNSPLSWAKMAREAGANALFGVGEMPAGTLSGRLKPIDFSQIDKPGFQYPKGYRKDDHSWVKAFVDAGHAQELKVVIYDGAWRTLDPILHDHPEWRQRSADGKIYRHGFGSWHSPYRGAYIQRWVDVARQFAIDGVMIDMLFTGPTGGDYSEFTVRAFRKRFGVDPPREADPRNLVWQRWIDFQVWTREEVLLELTEGLHAVDPEIAVIVNQTQGWIFHQTDRNFLRAGAARYSDGLLEEMGWDVANPYHPNRPTAWPVQSAWQSLYLHSRAVPGYGQMWHKNGLYTKVNHKALSYSMLANGVAPAVVTGGNWDYMRDVWAHIKSCEGDMTGAMLVPYVALHAGDDTLDWYANSSFAKKPEKDQRYWAYVRNLFGFFQALVETHTPVEIIGDDELADLKSLARFSAVLLPNSASLSNEQTDTLAAYVGAGGGLVASFESGAFDENGTRRERGALEQLLGVKQLGLKSSSTWRISATNASHPILNDAKIRNGGEPSQGSRDRKPYIRVFSGNVDRPVAIVVTEAGPDVESVPVDGLGPGVSLLHAREVGDGRVVYFPPDIGNAYFTYNHPVSRLLIERAVRWAAQDPPPCTTDAPMAVQMVCYRKGDNVIVHLVNDNSSYGRATAPNAENFGGFRDEVLPVYEIAVDVLGAFAKAKLLPEGRILAVEQLDAGTRVIVPKVDIHAMVVLSP
jgi:hypothetical protein